VVETGAAGCFEHHIATRGRRGDSPALPHNQGGFGAQHDNALARNLGVVAEPRKLGADQGGVGAIPSVTEESRRGNVDGEAMIANVLPTIRTSELGRFTRQRPASA
jgi:hypothetical protein